MDQIDLGWIARASEVFGSFLFWLRQSASWLWDYLNALQAAHPSIFSPQTGVALVTGTIAVWNWWEGRERRLFRKFEAMIAHNEAELVKSRDDLLDVMTRPGPGVRIRPPLFVAGALRRVLKRRRWHPSSLLPFPQRLDATLERAMTTSTRKVAAHQTRLSLFRSEIAAARCIQGALAAGRAAQASELADQQSLDQEALDHFRAAVALSGHNEDVIARELLAHQVVRTYGNSQQAIEAYETLIEILSTREESPGRNNALARAHRYLAIQIYTDTPLIADGHLQTAIALMMQFGPPRDRDLLDLAETIYLEGLARLRLGATNIGPEQLRLARAYYRGLLRHLEARRTGLFHWMRTRKMYSGHRVRELRQRAEQGEARVDYALHLFRTDQPELMNQLMQGLEVNCRNQ
jgi:tetratricopeptide (TPR) repeat protein